MAISAPGMRSRRWRMATWAMASSPAFPKPKDPAMRMRLDTPSIFSQRCAGLAFKPLEVVADRHGEGQELFERLPGFGKPDGDLAGGEPDAGRQVFELLFQYGGRRFDQQRGLRQNCRQPL